MKNRTRRTRIRLINADEMEFIHYTGVGTCISRSNSSWNDSSSPRVWGTPVVVLYPVLRTRFIPTGVGNTGQPGRQTAHNAVHPHGCGEHNACSVVAPSITGSSPRVWGTLAQRLCTGRPRGSSPRVWGTPKIQSYPQHPRRFIPTGVGNTHWGDYAQNRRTVHPHGCGEQQEMSLEEFTKIRFIPTGVGNTEYPLLTLASIAVHPHGCGEHNAVTIEFE